MEQLDFPHPLLDHHFPHYTAARYGGVPSMGVPLNHPFSSDFLNKVNSYGKTRRFALPSLRGYTMLLMLLMLLMMMMMMVAMVMVMVTMMMMIIIIMVSPRP